MKNKTLLIIIAVLLAGVITYLIYSSQKTKVQTSPVPQNQAQKDFDRSFSEIKKIKPKAIEAIKLPDRVISSFEYISANKLGFMGNDQSIYVEDLNTQSVSAFDVPKEVNEEDPTFITFNDDLTQAIVGFKAVNKVAIIDLTSNTSKLINVQNPLSAIYQEKFYVLAGKDNLKVSVIENGATKIFRNTAIQSENASLQSFVNKIILLSENGTYLITSTEEKKISDATSLRSGFNGSNLALINEQDEGVFVELFDKDLNKKQEIARNFSIKDVYLAPSESVIYLSASSSNETNDKLLKIGFDGKETEIILPDKYPDFLREFKIDRILSVDSEKIYYADQGNVFKIKI